MKQGEGCKVLFIEDDPSLTELIKAYFLIEKLDLTLAKTGAEAIKFFSENPFDLIVTDLHLPDIGAVDLITKFKEIDKTVIIIATSGSHHNEFSELDEYIWEFIEKPYKLQSLLHILIKGIEYGKLLKENINLKDRVSEVSIDKRYYQVFNQSPNMILILGQDGTILDSNIKANESWGEQLLNAKKISNLDFAFDELGIEQVKEYFLENRTDYLEFHTVSHEQNMFFFLEPIFHKGELELFVAEWHEG